MISKRAAFAAIPGILVGATLLFGLSSCASDADVASKNLSKAADNFEVPRKITFYDGVNGIVMLEIHGLCSLGNADPARQLSVTCKTDKGFAKSFLGLSDNISFMVEQEQDINVSTSRYRIVWKPSVVIPDIDLR